MGGNGGEESDLQKEKRRLFCLFVVILFITLKTTFFFLISMHNLSRFPYNIVVPMFEPLSRLGFFFYFIV